MQTGKNKIWKFLVKGIITLVLNAFIFSMVATPQVLASSNSFGISPPSIRNTSLLPGSSFNQVIMLSRATPTEDATATVVIEGQLAQWITFQPSTIKMPKGEQQVPIIATVKVPTDAALGEYKGTALVKLQNSTITGQVVLAPAIAIDINLKVGATATSIIGVQTSTFTDTEQDTNLKFTMKFSNEGNTAASPTSIVVTFLDTNRNKVHTYNVASLPTINPFSTETKEFSIAPFGLQKGEYFAIIEVFGKNGSIYKETLAFNILAKKTNNNENNSLEAQASRNQKIIFAIFITVDILILIAIVLITFYIKKLRKKDESKAK